MAGAGDYPTRFEWQRKGKGPRDAFGQPADDFRVLGHLWGAVEALAGSRGSAKESERAEVRATIRIRNYLAIAAGDRLRDAGWGEVWTVETVARGDNELRLDVTRPRWTAGGGTAQ